MNTDAPNFVQRIAAQQKSTNFMPKKRSKKSIQHLPVEFPHQGILRIDSNGIIPSVSWREEAGGEIKFKINNQGERLSYSQLFTEIDKRLKQREPNEEQQLNFVNQLLAHYRPHGIPDKNGYYASSACVTKEGAIFLTMNNEKHIKNPFAGRGCAETAALREAQESLGKEHIQFSRVYLMSGMAKRNGDQFRYQPGEVSCLCGECRQNFRHHLARGARFIMVPTNDGTQQLTLHNAASASELGEDQAWLITPNQMYPLPETISLKSRDYPNIKKIMTDGFDYITNSQHQPVGLETDADSLLQEVKQGNTSTETLRRLSEILSGYDHHTTEMQALEHYPTLTNINRSMLQLVKKSYEDHVDRLYANEKKHIEITVALIETEKGKFYNAVSVVGPEWLTSKPEEIPVALSNALNHTKGIKNVYMMTFNDKQIREEMLLPAKVASHKMKMPNPAGIGRLLKNMPKMDDAPITIIPPNNGELSEQELAGTIPAFILAREAFGPDFLNPKRALQKISHIE